MTSRTDDLRIERVRPLLSPAVLAEDLPISETSASGTHDTRRAIEAVLFGDDRRLLVIVGPCSIHDPAAALDYATRLRALADSVVDRVFVTMRVYFEKPRTVVGWKGLINDPDLDGSYRINKGLRLARRLLADITELGLPCGTEFLDTTFGQFYADLVSWGAIGARTAESQIHRELASGLSMPVGIKNRTDGNVQVAVDAHAAPLSALTFPASSLQEGAFVSLATAEGLPVFVRRRGEEITALDGRCTHMGCPVRLQEAGGFLCPCHGGRFDGEGAPVQGPPTRALARLPVRVDGSSVTVAPVASATPRSGASARRMWWSMPVFTSPPSAAMSGSITTSTAPVLSTRSPSLPTCSGISNAPPTRCRCVGSPSAARNRGTMVSAVSSS